MYKCKIDSLRLLCQLSKVVKCHILSCVFLSIYSHRVCYFNLVHLLLQLSELHKFFLCICTVKTQEPRVSIPKLKLLKETITNAFLEGTVETEVDHIKEIDIKPEIIDTTIESRDVPIYEEETRMSADAGSSRAQTPAKQVRYCIG